MRTRSGGEGAGLARQLTRKGTPVHLHAMFNETLEKGRQPHPIVTRALASWGRMPINGEFAANGNRFDCGKRGKLRSFIGEPLWKSPTTAVLSSSAFSPEFTKAPIRPRNGLPRLLNKLSDLVFLTESPYALSTEVDRTRQYVTLRTPRIDRTARRDKGAGPDFSGKPVSLASQREFQQFRRFSTFSERPHSDVVREFSTFPE